MRNKPATHRLVPAECYILIPADLKWDRCVVDPTKLPYGVDEAGIFDFQWGLTNNSHLTSRRLLSPRSDRTLGVLTVYRTRVYLWYWTYVYY